VDKVSFLNKIKINVFSKQRFDTGHLEMQHKSDMCSGTVPDERSSLTLYNKLKVYLATLQKSARKTIGFEVK